MEATTTDKVTFRVNGRVCEVGCEVTSKLTLVDYIRKTLNFPGTKYMCRQGGCGACIVTASKSPGDCGVAVNSCLVSVTSCQDWDITTIEGLGNRKIGYNPLQTTLAHNSGTQCGYCSPGWVMSMHSLLQRKNRPTKKEIENSLSSNVCRCTGYRPILKAFKEFASVAQNNDIPNIDKVKTCNESNISCDEKRDGDWCCINKETLEKIVIKINLRDGRVWYKVHEIEDVFEVFHTEGIDSYMLVAGNTAKAVYAIAEYPRVLIDVTGIEELKNYEFDQNLIIGAGVTLSELIDLFDTLSGEENFSYLKEFWQHLLKVAHVSVRNLASIAGNLMVKHEHRDFPSDLYLLLECVGAKISICSRSPRSSRTVTVVTMQDFLSTDMNGKIILSISLPPLSQEYKIVTYKIMPRSQATVAIVNAAYLYKLDEDNIVVECKIACGGLSDRFIRAVNTERFLVGKNLFRNSTLQSALRILNNEMIITGNPPKASPKYRRQLTLALFYKGLLTLCPVDMIQEQYRSGAIRIHSTRPLSIGSQIYTTDKSFWPINQPIPKVEGLIQCAGEAFYTDDLPNVPHEMSAAFVLATIPKGEIVHINADKALKCEGVIAFYTAEDIPGLNSFTPADNVFGEANEEVFCDGTVKYYNQPLGIVVAESQEIANAAVKLVEVEYKNIQRPVLTIEEAKKDPSRITLYEEDDATAKGDDVVKVINGTNSIYGQYYFAMENMMCLVQPTEEGLKVNGTAQWLDAMQLMISRALNIDQSRIDVHIRRLGGSYGLKVSRTIQNAVACSLAASQLNRPCRLVVPMQVATKAVGKRFPCHTDFEVGVNACGKIQYMNYNLYEDNGYTINELIIDAAVGVYNNCYDKSTWNFKSFNTTTDTHKNSWCRGPGNLESTAMAEYVMEQIACELGLDPLEVRLANIAEEYDEIKQVVDTVKINSNYYERRAAVEEFNEKNRWVKRGLRCSLMRWSPIAVGRLQVILSVYHGDGTVALTHGGIEMGQGLNTKAIQMCAYLLKIPIEKIQIKENNTTIVPDVYATIASLGSQNIALGITQCCEELLKRLEPIRQQLTNPTWEELIKTAFVNNVNLQTCGFMSLPDAEPFDYTVYGVAVGEVEVDILTGEFEVIRVDLEIDLGLSTSPLIDFGQIEGAFIMGQGYWTTEDIVRDKLTGEILTDTTSNYFVPLATDIPQDFRIYFKEKSYSFKEIFGAKAVGEPSICLSAVIPFALRHALTAARLHSGISPTEWFPIKGPYTIERIALTAETNTKDFRF